MPMEWRNGGGQCNGFLLCRGRYRKCFEFIPSYVRALFPLNNHLPIKLKLEVGTVSFFYISISIICILRESQHDAIQIVNNLSNLGQIYNREGLSTNVLARRQVLGEDGVCVHSMVLPGLPSSTTVYFS
ncbi:hypothetical protein V6N11_013171 [Hibiscus sabdariffa]|uniref:Uncharacterized protein n=1 Tax=Hibiscus sabdariffa TaxID=183260 RepID=A0ABR2NF29_9ROSI